VGICILIAYDFLGIKEKYLSRVFVIGLLREEKTVVTVRRRLNWGEGWAGMGGRG